jgi:hypothetical protein
MSYISKEDLINPDFLDSYNAGKLSLKSEDSEYQKLA